MVLNWRTAQRYRPASFSTSEGLFIDDQSVTGSRGASSLAAACFASSRAGCRARSCFPAAGCGCTRTTCMRSAPTAAASTSAGSRRRPTPTTARARRRTKASATCGSSDGTRFLLKDAVDQAGDLLLGKDVWSARRAGTCSASSSTTWGHPASHAPERRAGEAGRPPRQARGLLLSAAVQPDGQQLSLHVHGTRARHDEGRRAALPRELEPRRQRHHLPVDAPIGWSAAPAGRSIRASCTRRARSSPTSRR